MTSDLTDTVPKMGADRGYEIDERAAAPVRVSGFLCLLFGLLSALALLGRPLLLLPAAAVLCGLVALRPSAGTRPVGTLPAKIGLVLAVGFGVCGFFLPWMKSQTLGSQAAYFARQYIGLVAQDEAEMAMELQRPYRDRHLGSMPLDEFYLGSEDRREALQEFRHGEAYRWIREVGADADWQLAEPVRVYREHGYDKASTLWTDGNGSLEAPIYVVLGYQLDPETGDGQWHVEGCRVKQEPRFAESVL